MKRMIFTLVILIIFFLGNVAAVITSSIDSAETCNYRWFCTNWLPSECPENGIQTRTCTNAGDCSENYRTPIEKRGCELIPSQLFDIKMELEEDTFYNSDDLTIWVRFENFGQEPTFVNLTFTIYNEGGEEVFQRKKVIEVETEKFIIENFVDLNLDFGKYNFVLKTIYNVDIEDKFIQKFEIKDSKSIYKNILWIIFILILIYFIVMIFRYLSKKTSGEE